MFEYEGQQYTLEDLQLEATQRGVSFDHYLKEMKKLGLTDVRDRQLMKVDEELGWRPEWFTDYSMAIARGGVSLMKGVTETFESETVAEGFLAGKTKEQMVEDGTISAGNYHFRVVMDELEKYATKKYDKDGNQADVLTLLEEGRVSDAADLGSEQAISNIFSFIAGGVNPLLGATLIGTSSYGSNFTENIEGRYDPTKMTEEDFEDLRLNSIYKAGAEFAGEYIGARIWRGAAGLTSKGVKSEVVKEYNRGVVNRTLRGFVGGFGSEFISEGMTNFFGQVADVTTFDDEKTWRDYYRGFINDGIIGGLLGGPTAGGMRGTNPVTKDAVYKLAASRKWQSDMLDKSLRVQNAEAELEKASDRTKDVYQKRLDLLKKDKQRHLDKLYAIFDNKSGVEMVTHAKRLDRINKLYDIYGDKKASQEARKDAEREIRDLYTEINEDTESFINIDTEVFIGKMIKAREEIDAKKGIRGFGKDLKIKYLKTEDQVQKAIKETGQKDLSSADGLFMDGNTKTIYVNEVAAAAAGATNVLGHELLHYVFSKNFKTDNASMKPLVDSFKKYLVESGNSAYVRRIEKRMKDNGYFDKNGVIKEGYLEEYFEMFSDLIENDQMKLMENEKAAKPLAKTWTNFMVGLGFKSVKLETGKDVFDFLRLYTKNVNRKGLYGAITKRRIAGVKLTSSKVAASPEVVSKESKFSETKGKRASKSQAAESINKIEQGLKDKLKADNQEYTKDQFLYSEEFDDIYRSIKESNGAINNYILSLGLGDKKTKKVIQYASDRLKGYNPQEKRKTGSKEAVTVGERVMSDIMYAKLDADKSLAIESKKEGKTLRIDAAKRTQEGESTFDLEDTGVDAGLEALETEDMSPAAQAKKKADEAKGSNQRYSELRQEMGFKREVLDEKGNVVEKGDKIHKEILDDAIKSLMIEYSKAQNIEDIGLRVRTVADKMKKQYSSLNSPFFKQIKNFLTYGIADAKQVRGEKVIYLDQLKKFREAITENISTADFVQIHRNDKETDKIFVNFIKRVTKIDEVKQLIKEQKLDPSALNTITKDKKTGEGSNSVPLYDKTLPSETELISWADQPLINSVTGLRSGLKGTRKDGITMRLANSLTTDATMEAFQSDKFQKAARGFNLEMLVKTKEIKLQEKNSYLTLSKLEDGTIDIESLTSEEKALKLKVEKALQKLIDKTTSELSAAIGREANVKFSKSIIIDGKKTFSEDNLNNMFNKEIKHTSLMGDNQKQKSIKFIDSTIRNLDPVVYSTVVYQLEVLKEQISKDLTIKEIINSTISETKHLYSDVADYQMQLELHNGVLNKQHLTNYLVKAKRITDVQFSGIAFNSLVENLEQQTTATKINNFLKIHGKQAKTVKVMYNGERITNNKLMLEHVIKPIAEKNNIKGYGFVYTNKAKTKTRITYKRKEQTGFQNSTEIKQAFKNNDQEAISKIIKKYLEESDLAIKSVFDVINSKNSKELMKSIIKFMAADTDAVLRKIAKPGKMAMGFDVGKTVLDHRVPINKVIEEIYKTIDNPTSANKQSLKEFLENTYVNNIPKNVDTKLNASVKKGGLGFKTEGGMEVMNSPEIVELMEGVEVKDYSNVKQSRSTKSEGFVKAINFSRSTNNSTKGITVLDFDDTLATTKSLVKFTRPDGTTGTLNAEQYASTYENLLDQGYTFDFSEFNKVVKGKLAPLFQKALKLQGKFGPKNMFVLTARPPAAQKAIFDFLKANGLNIPIDNITGLGNSTAEAKALWMAEKVGEGFNDFYFADDALQNVQAVDDVLSQLGVKRKVQQAKVKFSKSLGKDLSKNKNYTEFRNSLKGSVLYHGGTASLSDNKAVWFIASDIVGAEAYADRKDGKVYSINSNNLNDAIIIPDVSDLIGLDKVIKNKYKSIAKEVLDKYGQVDIKKVLETDIASEVVSDFMDYINNNFELLDGVYGPETLYDNDGKISKGVPVIVLGGNVSTKVSKVKFSKSMQTIPAVANMLDQFDVKSKVQQAKIKFSRSMDDKFNDILEDVTGIETQKRFSAIKGRKRGEDKGKFRFFIPPSHEDFVGLLYNFMGKGREGDAHRNFLEQALVRPLNRAYRELDTAKQAIANDYKKLNEQFPDVNDKLIKTTPDGDFTFQDAIRVYLWNKHGHKIPGLTETDQAKLTKLVESDPQLQAYAETLNVISKQEDYVAPGQAWETANIRIDLVDATGRVGRAQYLSEFIENSDVLFSEENLNKIEAGYGKDFREALEDMLHRIKTGVNRPKGQSGKPNKFLNWLNASVAGVMFFNTRSALLQQLSNVNYLNFADNNILAAGKAFANQKQYWKDFAFILNSDMLKQRRGGIGTDVNGAELVEAIKKARPDSLFDQVAIITGKLLRLGFLPTQMGDSIAIATGGAAFYRNRVNTYLKQGLSQKEAEAKAFTDFQDITQSTQQSARPDMTSQQQASWIGKLVLNFLNTPSQYNRIIKKAGSDLKNRRITKPNTSQTQSDMSNLSRILYYGAAQNLIFYGLQTALFAVTFGTEDDDESEAFLKKKERVINGSIDTILRGSGIYGVALSTLKNMMIKFAEQREKGYNKDESAVIMEALNFSPVIGIRARKIVNAEKTLNYNTKVIDEMTTFDIDNPQWSAVTNYIEGTTTLPVNRLYQKTINVRNALDNQYTAFQRAMFFSGYTTWSLDLGDTEKMKKIKSDIKGKNKRKKKNKGDYKSFEYK